MNFLFQNFTDFLSEAISSFVDALTMMIIEIYKIGEEMALGNELAGVNNCLLFIQGISTLFFGCMVCKQIFTTYIAETDGDPDMDPTQILIKFSMSMAVSWASGSLISILCGWGWKATAELTGSAEVEYKNAIEGILGLISGGGQFALLVALLIYVIGVCVFIFKAGIRGGELVLFKLLTPIFAGDIITPSRERWNAFFAAYLVTIFGYSFQLLLFRFSIQILIAGDLMHCFVALSFLYLSIITPKWLERFVYSSGLGRIAGQSAHSAAFIAASFIRRG